MSNPPYLTPDAARDAVAAELDAMDTALARLAEVSTDLVGNVFRVEVTDRVETQRRRLTGLSYRMFAEMADPPDADPAVSRRKRGRAGKKLRDVLAHRLRLDPNEIKRRFRVAAKLAPRRALTGEPLPPRLPVLAQAVAQGRVDETHIAAVLTALRKIPRVAAEHLDDIEAILVGHALVQDAPFVASVGATLAEELNPDQYFDDRDRQAQSGLHMGKQRPDGMTYIKGWITPELRANLEALDAAHTLTRHRNETTLPRDQDEAKPHDSDEAEDDIESDEDEAEIDEDEADGPAVPDPDGRAVDLGDTRSGPQRLHDALNWGLRTAIASGDLGTHRGIPLTVIVTTTLQQIDQAIRALADPSVPMPAPARTGGGSVLPWRDLIRMAADSIHYLSVFDEHTGRPLYLGRSQRLATLDQRIICHARDHGCTRPDCGAPGYACEVMHTPDWHPDGATDADKLYFGCPDDHGLASTGHATLTITDQGRLAWSIDNTPPRTNRRHHPQELLQPPPPDTS